MKHLAVVAALVVALIAPSVVQATPTASVSGAKHTKKTKRKKQRKTPTTPQVLVPHVIEVPGEIVALCDTGINCSDAPEVAVSFATCPSGYTVVGGGWETYSNDAPRNAVVTQNHPVSTKWLVAMEAPNAPRGTPPDVARFRAIAQCQILLPA